MRLTRSAATILFLARCISAQPGIGQNGVVNSASQIPPTLPGGTLARGALFQIRGVRFGEPGHAQVTLHQGQSSFPVRVFSNGPKWIDAMIPSDAPLGREMLTVTAGGRNSRPFPVEVVASNPGIFSRNGEGWGPGRIQNVSRSGARTDNGLKNPAMRGQTIVLTATGLGNIAKPLIVIGTRAVKSTRHAATKPGEDEIAVVLPQDAPVGCYVPLYVQISPMMASNVVTVAISATPGRCQPALVPPLEGERAGIIGLFRMRMKSARPGLPDSIEDTVSIRFGRKTGTPGPLQLPPLGSCVSYTSSFQSETPTPTSINDIIRLLQPENIDFDLAALDAGEELTLRHGSQVRILRHSLQDPGHFKENGASAAGVPKRKVAPEFLDPGEYRIIVAGGSDIRPFQITVPGPEPFVWTDRDQIATVNRSKPLTVHWKGSASARTVVVVASNIDRITTAGASCVCMARADAGQFTIPPGLLANLPESQDYTGVAYDRLMLVSLIAGNAAGIQAGGLDQGWVIAGYIQGRIVQYR